MGQGSRETLHDFIPVYHSFIFTHPKTKGGGGVVTKESCLSTKTSAEIVFHFQVKERKKEGTKEGRKEKKEKEAKLILKSSIWKVTALLPLANCFGIFKKKQRQAIS